MTINNAKQILGKVNKDMSDQDLEQIIKSLSNLADIFIEQQKGIVNYGDSNIQ
ncbi:MAG TPA: hypothetical protein VKC54_03485 [Patescibacteria group bacterium]|nr:hypothetical protein [Patescibacteria group bacterium]